VLQASKSLGMWLSYCRSIHVFGICRAKHNMGVFFFFLTKSITWALMRLFVPDRYQYRDSLVAGRTEDPHGFSWISPRLGRNEIL